MANKSLTPTLQVGIVIWTLSLILIPGALAQTNYQRLKSFGFSEFSSDIDPASPLLEGQDGMLYGTTFHAFQDGHRTPGTIYRLRTDGSGFGVLHRFSEDGEFGPQPGLVQGVDGFLYGTTTYGGGPDQAGTVFRMNTNGNDYAVLHGFSVSAEGGSPRAGLVLGADGVLYGTTSYGGSGRELNGGAIGGGTVFKLKTDGSDFSVLYRFGSTNGDGRKPYARLIQGTDGALYGTTYGGGSHDLGTLFKLSTNGSGYTILATFKGAENGANPQASLVEGEDGALYSTTYGGGSDGYGTVFKLNKSGTDFIVLHHFAAFRDDGRGPQSPLIYVSGSAALYGTASSGGTRASGVVFRINTDGSKYAILHNFDSYFNTEGRDGTEPAGGLMRSRDGRLYGTTIAGGRVGDGSVFKLNINGSAYRILFNFNLGGGDGESPLQGLVQDEEGILYGTTTRGGSNNFGTVYKLNPDTLDYQILYSFTGVDGPNTRLVLVGSRTLFGTTSAGDGGTVFRLNTDGSGFRVLHSFPAKVGDGFFPRSDLVPASDGTILGTTYSGGRFGFGTIFKLNQDGRGYTIVHNFNLVKGGGGRPVSLIEGSDGVLYGATEAEASSTALYFGTIFRLNKSGSGFRVLHYFDYFDLFLFPYALANGRALVQNVDGGLYGIAVSAFPLGGREMLFGLNTNGSGFRLLHQFGGYPLDGARPNWLGVNSAGIIFGTTEGGGTANAGTVFKINADGTGYTILHSLHADASPVPGLVINKDGSLFGVSSFGGDLRLGSVFKLFMSPSASPKTRLQLESLGARLFFSGATAGQLWQIEASANLSNPSGWQFLGSAQAGVDGTFQFFDLGMTNYTSRFYRGVLP